MNILHFVSGRDRAADPCKASNGLRRIAEASSHSALADRPPHLPPALRHATLSVTWSHNALTGALECHWVADVPARRDRHFEAKVSPRGRRMHRPGSRASLRPPSRERLR